LYWHRQAPSLGKKLLLGLLLAAAYLTFSLTGLAALTVIFFFYFKETKNFRAITLGALILVGVLLSANWRERFEQLSQMNLAAEIQTGEISNSFSWRVLHWYVLFQHAREHPITGWGLLTTEKITPWKTGTGQGYAAHNDAVRIFLEAGIVGLIGYLIFLFSAGRWIFRSPKGAKPGRLRPALKAVFASLLVLSFGAAEPLVHTAFVYYFFAFLALEKNGFEFGMLKAAPRVADKNFGGNS
jgi:O-antigen ligase